MAVGLASVVSSEPWNWFSMNPLVHIVAHPTWIILQGPGIDLADGNQSGGGLGSVLVAVLAVIGGVALIVMIVLAVRWVRSNVTTNPSPAPTDSLNRDTRRRIKDAINDGDYETAGDLYHRAKLYNDAAEAYAKGKAYLKAARAFQATDNTAQAIHYYKQAGEFKQAAILYAKDDKYRSAAAEYVQANEYGEAAKYYALAGDNKRAAEYYQKSGEHLRAATLFEEADATEQAAQEYALYVSNLLKKHKGDYSQLGEDREYAFKAANLYRDAGKPDYAAELFQKTGYFKEAADCVRSSGDFSRAAELLMQAGQHEAAAKILEEGGEAHRAARMRAASALEKGDLEQAANEFFKGEVFDQAAELFVELEQWERAAEVFDSISDHSKAGKMFEKAELHAKAAKSYEAGTNFAKAAEMYKRANDLEGRVRMLELLGDNFEASRLLFELREYERALTLLERIDSSEPLYLKSLELQGDIIRAQGRFEKSFSRYRSALGTRSADLATIPLFYKMARVLEEINDYNGAMQNYEVVIGVDVHYEDAGLRLKALQDRQRRTKTSSSGLFSANDMGEGNKRYEIVEEVARGGMGIVYKAQDTVLGRIVAYKVLGENLRENSTAVKYFLREARAAAALSHPNIVTIFDAGEQSGEYYMAMEFVEGTTLKELIKRTGALPNEQIEYIMINCCRALEYAHSKGVIHRDIKSGNVMITRDRTLKVMDFGLAKFLREYQNNHTQQVGTPFYMSPEQIVGRNVDFRSDLYSLGCMLFECATGTVPFFKGDLSYHHIHTPPPRPSSINPGLSKRMEAMILKLLQKKPDDRYQSAADVIKIHAAGKV